jgi:reverse gyrase
MRLKDWELTIQKIVDESNHEQKEMGKHKVLTAWRSKLEKEPTSLPPYQIDEIVREVRRRLGTPAHK